MLPYKDHPGNDAKRYDSNNDDKDGFFHMDLFLFLYNVFSADHNRGLYLAFVLCFVVTTTY